MSIDDDVDEIIKDDNPTAQAVESLIKVRDQKKGQQSEIELKTDLDDSDVCVHTSVDMLQAVLEMEGDDMATKSILGILVNKKERKLLSKDRKSRLEIVEVARHPDMNVSQDQAKQGFVQRFFSRRKTTPQ